jgi:serine/threonine-protein kinase
MPIRETILPTYTIAHYRITSKLGEGGMGEVHRATDTRLNREVAIKTLPEAFAEDAFRMARFAREAQVLASLNHPNIAAIYGLEVGALVMELVEGPTLAQRILQGPIPIDEALAIARQIAEALEYAHDHAIVHRDLKPANIKITPEGRVKMLDFGLAKALSNDTAEASAISSPTLTMGATMAGTIMGTAAYMSPEQARGQSVDRRADIWAFGVVLHEMLTGRALFQQATISDTLAAVLRADPDWSGLPSGLPANIRTMLQRCLERDPRRRLRDIGDARLELEQPAARPIAAAPASPVRLSAILPGIVATLLGVVAVTAAIHMRGASPPTPLASLGLAAPDKVTSGLWLGLSPDGRHLAFTAAGADGTVRLWLRSLDSAESRPLAGTEGTVTFFWSPDSRVVVFQSAGKLKKIDISGSIGGVGTGYGTHATEPQADSGHRDQSRIRSRSCGILMAQACDERGLATAGEGC